MQNAGPDRAQEAEWIERCQGGEGAAFGLLVERYRRKVHALVFRLVHRPDEVEDLGQEVFIKAFRAIRTYDGRSAFGTWLARIAVNHCYDYLRRVRASRVSYLGQSQEGTSRAMEARAEDLEAGGPDSERQAASRDLVSKLLGRAPAEDRTVLVLREMEELSVQEIAEIMNLKPGVVKVRLHRARKRMLADLKRLRQGR
jgi:RNA polymerase sigma-70 factor (ECF subfamily)